MEESIIQTFAEILRKELAPIKLDIAGIKQEIVIINRRLDKLETRVGRLELGFQKLQLQFHEFQVKNERIEDHIAIVVENIKTAGENRSMILDHDKRIRILEVA
jgi:chromosome segregation ATPase